MDRINEGFKDDNSGWTWDKVAKQPLNTIIIPSIGIDDLPIHGDRRSSHPCNLILVHVPPALSLGFDQRIRLAFNHLRNSETDFELPAVVIDLKSFGFDSLKHNSNSEFKDIRQYNWMGFSVPGKDTVDPELLLYYDTGARNDAEETNGYLFSISYSQL